MGVGIWSMHFVAMGPAIAGCTPALVIESDSRKLRQILVNLATNAIKFAPHGEVSISLSS